MAQMEKLTPQGLVVGLWDEPKPKAAETVKEAEKPVSKKTDKAKK